MLLPPRILIVMPDDGKRALLRAALREVGYDAVGARTIHELGARATREPDRGPIRLVLVDQDVIPPGDQRIRGIAGAHGARIVLLAHATREAPAGPWSRVVRRPVNLAELVAVVQALSPLRPTERRPVDVDTPPP